MRNLILYNETFIDFYRLSNVIRIVKSRSLQWVENVARTEKKRSSYRLFVEKLVEKRPL
jgi:hypothetical protein